MILNTNVQALIANNSLWHKNNDLAKESGALSLGVKISKAGDNPTGMAVSNKIKMQIKGLELAERNSGDATSLIQTAESGMNEIQRMIIRVRELAVSTSNDTMTPEDRKLVECEVNSLFEEIDSLTDRLEFNNKSLLNDDYKQFIIQVGGREGQEVAIKIGALKTEDLNINPNEFTQKEIPAGNPVPAGSGQLYEVPSSKPIKYTFDLTSTNAQGTVVPNDRVYQIPDSEPPKYTTSATRPNQTAGGAPLPNEEVFAESIHQPALTLTTVEGSQDALDRLDIALNKVSEERANLGAMQNRLDQNIISLVASQENAKHSLSRILDTDMASAMSDYTKDNILVQSSIAMIAQANKRPNQLLSLLQ